MNRTNFTKPNLVHVLAKSNLNYVLWTY